MVDKKATRIVLGIEYEGTNYHGFQKQMTTNKTIQGFVEQALSKIANEKISTTCSGRTDTGVHAYNQVIHFDTSSSRNKKAWLEGGNSLLPQDIKFLWAEEVKPEFHARFSAISRCYRYVVRNSEIASALWRNKSLWVRECLELSKMRQGASHLLGEKDFTSFRAAACQSKTPLRNIKSLTIAKKDNFVLFEITANAFLLHMVRIIVGTLLEVGMNKVKPGRVKQILEAKNRNLSGKTASPEGLYFVGPIYLKKFKIPNISNFSAL